MSCQQHSKYRQPTAALSICNRHRSRFLGKARILSSKSTRAISLTFPPHSCLLTKLSSSSFHPSGDRILCPNFTSSDFTSASDGVSFKHMHMLVHPSVFYPFFLGLSVYGAFYFWLAIIYQLIPIYLCYQCHHYSLRTSAYTLSVLL